MFHLKTISLFTVLLTITVFVMYVLMHDLFAIAKFLVHSCIALCCVYLMKNKTKHVKYSSATNDVQMYNNIKHILSICNIN